MRETAEEFQCLRPASCDGIPFDNGGRRSALPNNTQAIVTSYQFHCCGDITEWRARVPSEITAYTIHFQVWRPSPTVESDGCYSMVGENRFSGTLSRDGGAVLTPSPANVISVRPGDVVGYYQTANRNGSGILLNEDLLRNETVWYQVNPEPGLPMTTGDESCPLPVGTQPDRILTSSHSLGPIISLDIGKGLFGDRVGADPQVYIMANSIRPYQINLLLLLGQTKNVSIIMNIVTTNMSICMFIQLGVT